MMELAFGLANGLRTIGGAFAGIKMALVLGAVAVPFAFVVRGCATDIQANLTELGGERVRAVVARERADVLERRNRESRARLRQASTDREAADERARKAEDRITALLERPIGSDPNRDPNRDPILEPNDGALPVCPFDCSRP